MKILILNGNPASGQGQMDSYIDELAAKARIAGHDVNVLVLRDLKIRPCTGCFNCWVKTPGTCSIKDDAADVARLYIKARHVIFASPLVVGFVSSLLKNTMDRNICLVHPHLEEVDGEVHHKKRYDQYPDISFLLEKEASTDDEDLAIARDIFQRQAINVRAPLGFVHFTETPVEEIINAINVH